MKEDRRAILTYTMSRFSELSKMFILCEMEQHRAGVWIYIFCCYIFPFLFRALWENAL